MSSIENTQVVVIGGAGFLGSHLVDYLIDVRNCDVLVLDNLISGRRKHIHPAAQFRWHDIRDDEDELQKILEEHGTRYLFNYAAEPYIPECFDRPKHFFDINATAVLKVLNASQKAGVEKILQVSSAEIYGDTKEKISEDAFVRPHSTYGVAKMAADGLVQVRWKEAEVPSIAMRQFNCVGERETHEYVIPEIISQVFANSVGKKKKEKVPIHLGNNSTRDFQYAGDAVRMAVSLLEHGELGEVYNMGSEDCITIYELADRIARIAGYAGADIETDEERKRPWEIWHLQSDNTKLYEAIPERPAVPLDEALRRTIGYFTENGKVWDF